MNRLRLSTISVVVAVALILVAGFESGWFTGPGAIIETSTSTIPKTTAQAQQSVKFTTIGNGKLYSFDFCSLPTGLFPFDWSTPKNKPGWSVQGCNLAYLGSSGNGRAYYIGRVFSNFTFALTATGLGYCPSNPAGASNGKLPFVLIMTFRQQSTFKLNGYSFRLETGKAELIKYDNGTPSILVSQGPLGLGSSALASTGQYTMTVSARGDTINATWYGPLDNGDVTQGSIAATDASFTTGWIGVSTYCHVEFKDMQVYAPSG